MGDEGFVEPPKVVGGTSVDFEDEVGVVFRIEYVLIPKRGMHEVSVVGVWGRAITLGRSRGRSRSKK